MNPILSIVIPFRNEGVEVENTLISIFDHSNVKDIEVIVINDASDDGYNYAELLDRYNIRFIENRYRIGVAASRDKGVQLSSGKFILFLDAHMRFYDNDWSWRIIDLLSSDEKLLLCSQSKGLCDINHEIREIKGRPTAYGTSINFINSFRYLECNWIYMDFNPTENIVEIPCVFGACYAVSKHTWMYIKGLSGLSQYGNDETYMSMKVWLSGGKIKLIKDFLVGHIYREHQPYEVDIASRIFNRIWIASLLLDSDYRSRAFAYSKNLNDYNNSLFILFEKKVLFVKLYKYYRTILKIPYTEFISFNNAQSGIGNQYEGAASIVNRTKDFILKYYHSLSSVSLDDGKLGAILFLAVYSKHNLDEQILGSVNQYIDEIIQKDFDCLNNHALLDLGWVLCFLIIQGLIKKDKYFSIIDRIVDIIAEKNVVQNDFVLFCSTIKFMLAISHFSEVTISKHGNLTNVLYNLCRDYCYMKIYSKEIFDFVLYMEDRITYIPSIYDMVTINLPLDDYNPESYNLGLLGCAGVGIKLIIDNYV